MGCLSLWVPIFGCPSLEMPITLVALIPGGAHHHLPGCPLLESAHLSGCLSPWVPIHGGATLDEVPVPIGYPHLGVPMLVECPSLGVPALEVPTTLCVGGCPSLGLPSPCGVPNLGVSISGVPIAGDANPLWGGCPCFRCPLVGVPTPGEWGCASPTVGDRSQSAFHPLRCPFSGCPPLGHPSLECQSLGLPTPRGCPSVGVSTLG